MFVASGQCAVCTQTWHSRVIVCEVSPESHVCRSVASVCCGAMAARRACVRAARGACVRGGRAGVSPRARSWHWAGGSADASIDCRPPLPLCSLWIFHGTAWLSAIVSFVMTPAPLTLFHTYILLLFDNFSHLHTNLLVEDIRTFSDLVTEQRTWCSLMWLIVSDVCIMLM